MFSDKCVISVEDLVSFKGVMITKTDLHQWKCSEAVYLFVNVVCDSEMTKLCLQLPIYCIEKME